MLPRTLRPAALALLMAAPALADDSKADKIEAQLAAGKPEAAWKTCEKIEEKGGIEDEGELEACARADLERQRAASPGGLSLEQLNGHWGRWNGTAAAKETRAAAAQLRLGGARGDTDMLAAIWGQFPDTPAGQAASDLLFQQAVDEGTSAAMAAFAERFPNAPQAEKARAQADDLLWRETEAQGTVEAWVAFIKAHPTHPRLAEAVRWQETLAFHEAEAEGTVAAWAKLLSEFPRHPRYEEAEQNRVNALFAECAAKGPEAMLAVAEAWPDHPRATFTRVQAWAMMMKVQLLSHGYGDPSWAPTAASEEPPVRAPVGADGLDVTFPAGQPPGRVDLVYVEAGQSSPLGGLYAERLAAQGFPSDRIAGLTQPRWLPPQGQVVSARLAEPLCKPDGFDAHFAVVAELAGQQLVFPFQVGLACSAARP
ncbi:MAG: hypothetical protein ABIO70_26895 [Pseudomonadota bacterium]